MSARQRLAILKFGGSVLQTEDNLARAAQEIYRWQREGFQVIAVASAIGNTTDQLCAQVRKFGPGMDSAKIARLLATGELQSAALLGLALDKAGLRNCVGDETIAGLRADGDPLDAQPVSLDASGLRLRLSQFGVLVMPGFIGRNDRSEICLLGRGGSDLTALFLARELDADVCRLIKDVSGLFEFDPKSKTGRAPARFAQTSYADALELDESIIQHKGVRFAQTHRMRFEVGGMFSRQVTAVGDFPRSQLAPVAPAAAPLRVTILGAGTVGRGVIDLLQRQFPDRFDIERVVVRDVDRARAAGIPNHLLDTDVPRAIHTDCEVVVELVGGDRVPESWIATALESGKHVVTANKSVMARSGPRLQAIARDHSVQLACSAAVGGAAPVLETLDQLVRPGHQVKSLAAIVNGSINFILDRIFDGASFDTALAAARGAGLTETNPHRDLSGIDAAEKLILMARHLGHELPLDEIQLQMLTAELVESVGPGGYRLRQVVRWSLDNPAGSARVGIERVPLESRMGQVTGAGNLVELTTGDGEVVRIHGTGAGRWPTTSAVVADLLDLESQRRDVTGRGLRTAASLTP